ncbi:MAG: N-acetylmuramoyl-L-alanine amidase [Bacteroidales bacterium]|jgi:N-acetylmuramoyl-L-alanine amidase|nr:N-acetylmuramoyl-L-alanine amidase [Bacteroidales bacterium]
MKVLYAATMLCIHLLLTGGNYTNLDGDVPVKIVVIDAGHGGHDPGAIGITGVKEKDVVLTIALKLGALIEKNTNVKVIYTRKTDVFVELHKRAQLANTNHADMFISIHCNSVENNSVATGSETYVMGLNKSQENLAIAQKENSAILSEKNYEDNYGGFDPTSPEAYIVFSLYQNAYLNQSISLAAAIQSEFKTVCKLQDRGVKQGALLVLWRSAMPSVLIETGFLSNKQEEAYLASEKGQSELAHAIYNGFAKVAQLSSPKEDLTNANTQSNKNNASSDAKSSKVVYKVQFLSSSKELKKTDPTFKNISGVEIEKAGKIYKYMTGNCATLEETQNVLTSVKKAGFSDAFIVAYKSGTRITLQEAKDIESNK